MTQSISKVAETKVDSFEEIDFERLIDDQKPIIFRGLAAGLPLVRASTASTVAAMDHVRAYYLGKPLTVFRGDPAIAGRFGYTSDIDGFNFTATQMTLDNFFSLLLEHMDDAQSPSWYCGSTDIDTFMPGLLVSDGLPICGEMFTRSPVLKSIWMGNRTTACAHFDISHNLAVCMVGHRRFTLFMPDQIENLYPGPLEPTPGGQVISLVDFTAPNFDLYPKFQKALDNAQVAELAPGDVLFYPSMWWHQVEALDGFNIMINYWWETVPIFVDSPMNTLLHGLLSLRGRSATERAAWRAIFDYYLFGATEVAVGHLPAHTRGDLGPLDHNRARRLRAFILNRLNR